MEILNYLWFAAYGLVAGVLAKTIIPGKDSGGLIFTSLLGICGSILGGYVFTLFGWKIDKGFSLNGLIPALLGSLLILVIYKVISKKLT